MRNHFIFLDFDGVLNTTRYQSELREKGIGTADQFGPLFDPLLSRVMCRISPLSRGLTSSLSYISRNSPWEIYNYSKCRVFINLQLRFL